MTPTICPFCGIVTNVPHNTQAGCIEALHDEITRMRTLLGQARLLTEPPRGTPTFGSSPESGDR